jgi:hypothetical protein
MSIDLKTILPNISTSLDGTGFLFGAGTSLEAGYPMMAQLTRDVINVLNAAERGILDEVLSYQGIAYDDTTANPNIEQISDLVIAHSINSGDGRFAALELRFRNLILNSLLAIKNPNIDNHCRFFEALKKRTFGLPCTIWIFTTNYDLLFEIAAARVGVTIENGFSGTIERYFQPEQFKKISGSIEGDTFRQNNQLTVKLIKLHGSISWVNENSTFYERHPLSMPDNQGRLMILPRRKKVMDTMTPPFDTLFNITSKVLGVDCKYIVSCGFSYADEHINEQLLLPVMRNNKCKLFALSYEEPIGIAEFKKLPNFSAGFNDHLFINGKSKAESTDAWKFSSFVKLFE